ncbi:hypothetical protein KQI84_07855 [bacterium]|nr:hypothetical protein [bacterium]
MKTQGAEKPMQQAARNHKRGFTAVEIAMVASVIALIALLILPIFRQRTREARIVAANDELSSIAKAQLLVEADAGIQARLQDLDNGPRIEGEGWDPPTHPPRLYSEQDFGVAWNGKVAISGDAIETNWGGPYLAFKREISMSNMPDFYLSTFGGPIFVDGATPDTVLERDRYPVDPWGQPYLFFGTETSFNSSVIFSLGEDGIPGDASAPGVSSDYERAPLQNAIQNDNGDDIEYRF